MDKLPPGIDRCAIAAGRPPNGVVSNLIDPPTLAPVTISICTILTVWAFAFTASRLFANWGKLKLADYFMAFGAILSITYTGLIISLSSYNRHMWDIPVCWFNEWQLKIIFAHTTIVGAVLFFPKCAIFFMYRDIFEIRSWMNGIIWFGLIFTFAIYFPSIPLSAIYETPKPGHSWLELLSVTDHSALIIWGIVQGSCSVALDIFIFILPIPLLSKLQLPFNKKIQLLVVFGTALFGVVASVSALYFRIQLLHSTDSTWEQARLGLCVVAENNVAIIAGSMPGFAKFMRFYVVDSPTIQSLRSRLRGTTKGQSYGSLGSGPSVPPNGTFGSPMKHRKFPQQFYELDESTLMQTEVSTIEEAGLRPEHISRPGGTGIVRTVGIYQNSRRGSDATTADQSV